MSIGSVDLNENVTGYLSVAKVIVQLHPQSEFSVATELSYFAINEGVGRGRAEEVGDAIVINQSSPLGQKEPQYPVIRIPSKDIVDLKVNPVFESQDKPTAA